MNIMLKKNFDKYKKFISDIFLNTLAFGIYMFAQQIILLPILAKKIDEGTYATFLIYISMLNLICNSVGSQLGVTRQVNSSNGDNSVVYKKILDVLSIIISFISIVFLLILKANYIDIIVLTIIVLLTNYRFYVRYIFRIEGNYKKIIIQNIIYLVGILVGLMFFYLKKVVWMPILIGELFCLVYDEFQIKKMPVKEQAKINCKDVVKKFSGYSISTILSNSCSLIDKILISPLLGQFNLIIYSVGTTVSKILALVTNPINDVILAWISKPNNNSKKIISMVVKFSILFLFVFSIVTIPIIYIATKILYSQYLDQIKGIIVLLSISGSISFVSSMMKSFVVRYSKSTKLVNVYLIHIVLFTLLGYVGAKIYGLNGFIISTIFSRFQLWLSFVILLYRILKKEYKNDKKV